MGSIQQLESAFLFAALFSKDSDLIHKGVETFSQAYGPVLISSEQFSFDQTDYYEEEMGKGLVKQFFLFDRIIEPSEIVDIKLDSNRMEKGLSGEGNRDLNIDPGYVTLAKMVLATTKNYSHRIYIGKGIYGEITLSWEPGSFCVNSWTYPDYAIDLAINFFNECRKELKKRN